MADWYGPIQRGVAGVSGVLERGTERESRHLTRMGELGLAGRQLGMQEEEFDLTRRLKGLQIGKLEREEGKRKAEEARMLEPSKLRDANNLSEFFGREGNEYWMPFAKKAISKDKYLYKDPKDPKRVTGFDIPKGEVAPFVSRALGHAARGDPKSLPDRLRAFRGLQDYLTNKFGATKDGNRKQDAQWRNAGREAERIEILIKALYESPAAGLTAIELLHGRGALKEKDLQIVDAYKKTAAAKGLKAPPRLYETEEGWQPRAAAIGLRKPITAPGQLTEFQKNKMIQTLNDDLEAFGEDPTSSQVQEAQIRAEAIGGTIGWGTGKVPGRIWGTNIRPQLVFVPGGKPPTRTPGGQQVQPRQAGETIEAYLQRTSQNVAF